MTASATDSAHPTAAAAAAPYVPPSTEYLEVNGKPVNVPRDILAEGRDAVHAWHTAQEAPHVEELLKTAGVTIPEADRTGHEGAIALADVHRGILARDLAAAAAAELEKKKGKTPPASGNLKPPATGGAPASGSN